MSEKMDRQVEGGGTYDQRADVILAQRNRHLAEIEALKRVRGQRTGFARKAHTLLTRAWARANWKTREELLKAAAWLLYLEHLREISGL